MLFESDGLLRSCALSRVSYVFLRACNYKQCGLLYMHNAVLTLEVTIIFTGPDLCRQAASTSLMVICFPDLKDVHSLDDQRSRALEPYSTWAFALRNFANLGLHSLQSNNSKHDYTSLSATVFQSA